MVNYKISNATEHYIPAVVNFVNLCLDETT